MGAPARFAGRTDGWDNTTFRLGDEFSVRLPSTDRYVPQVDKEHRWLPVLAPQLPAGYPSLSRERAGARLPAAMVRVPLASGRARDRGASPRPRAFAHDLSVFLAALDQIDPASGPPAGQHSFFRGGPLATYDAETRASITALADRIDASAATQVWQGALLATEWRQAPVWVHGDVVGSNLLVVDGRLSAVIDFGCSAVGDPACDLAIAWTFLSPTASRHFETGYG